jgi:hypothetical protein
MGYKVLGFAVWQGVKWYLRGKAPAVSRKPSPRALAIAGLGGAVIAGAAGIIFAQRRASAD